MAAVTDKCDFPAVPSDENVADMRTFKMNEPICLRGDFNPSTGFYQGSVPRTDGGPGSHTHIFSTTANPLQQYSTWTDVGKYRIRPSATAVRLALQNSGLPENVMSIIAGQIHVPQGHGSNANATLRGKARGGKATKRNRRFKRKTMRRHK